MTKQLVIFDMDGLLLDSERLSYRAWERTCADHGFLMTEEIFCQVVGRTVKESAIILNKILGEGFDYFALREKKMVIQAAEIEHNGIPLKTGVHDLLDKLESMDIRKIVATSTTRKEAEKKLSQAQIYTRFEYLVCGDEVKQGKPAPDIFLKAIAKSNLAPKLAIVIEDSPLGAQAAHAAGIEVAIVPDMKQPDSNERAFAKGVYSNLELLRLDLAHLLA